MAPYVDLVRLRPCARPIAGTRIFAIVIDIHNAIHSHRRGTRANHGDDDPENLPRGWPRFACAVASGEQRCRKCEGQCKNGVLKFDHFEHGANAALPGEWSGFEMSFGGHISSVFRKGCPFQANWRSWRQPDSPEYTADVLRYKVVDGLRLVIKRRDRRHDDRIS